MAADEVEHPMTPSSIDEVLPKRVRENRLKRYLASRFEVSNAPGRSSAMEGMRGFAALIVFFVHFNALFSLYAVDDSIAKELSSFAGAMGHVGVDVFFVLSGLLIYGILMRRKLPVSSFLWRRIERLYPTFLVVFGIYCLVDMMWPSYSSRLPQSPGALLWYLTVNALMLPGILPIKPMITVAWSLSYEVFFYVGICLTVTVFNMRGWPSHWRIIFFGGVALARLSLPGTVLAQYSRMTMFLAGVLLWEVTSSYRVRPGRSALAELGTGAFFIAVLISIGLSGTSQATEVALTTFPGIRLPLLFISTFGLSFYSMFGQGFLNRMFSNDYLRWFGNMSYSFYLVHGVALHGLRLLVGFIVTPLSLPGLLYASLLIFALLFATVAGALMFLRVEKPWSLTGNAALSRSARAPSPASEQR